MAKGLGPLLAAMLWTSSGFAQQTVYVAPVPQVGDPEYIQYQLQQLGTTLQRNQVNAAQVEALRSQTALNRVLQEQLKRDELDSLISLAALLDQAGTEEQKAALRTVIQQKLDDFIPASLRSYSPETSLVISTPGFGWAAEQVAGVLMGRPVAAEIGYGDAQRLLSDNPNVVGLLEVEINVYQGFESVKAICFGKGGGRRWEKKTIFNSGGGPEELAREMVGKLLRKIKGLRCP